LKFALPIIEKKIGDVNILMQESGMLALGALSTGFFIIIII
jgi:hypothetical protein